MNRRQYTRAITDTRKAIYTGDLKNAALGVLRAFVAYNDPEELPAPPPPRRLTAGSKTKRVKGGKVVRRK